MPFLVPYAFFASLFHSPHPSLAFFDKDGTKPALPRALSTVRERLERLELPASACLPAACVGRAGSFAYDDGDILV